MKIKDILVLVLLEHQRKQYPESTLHINKIRVASRDRLVTNRLGPGNFFKTFFLFLHTIHVDVCALSENLECKLKSCFTVVNFLNQLLNPFASHLKILSANCATAVLQYPLSVDIIMRL